MLFRSVEAVKCPEGLRERRSDEGAELAQVAHFDTEMPQGVLHRTGDALHRVCERAIEVEQEMSVFFRHCIEFVVRNPARQRCIVCLFAIFSVFRALSGIFGPVHGAGSVSGSLFAKEDRRRARGVVDADAGQLLQYDF